MALTRRQALKTAGAAVAVAGIAKPAIAQKSPIQIGYLPALTGPSSSTGVGINRGVQLAVDEINKAGGVDGRQLELISRDTQSDPTKAVNGAAELTRGHKVSVVFGPVNSGEALAVVPLLARANVPQLHPCWVDSLADPKKYPMCFRNGPTNQQIGGAANRYVVEVLKKKKVALISDTTGYGTASVVAYAPMLKQIGRGYRVPGACRCRQSGRQAGGAAHAGRGRRSDHAVERECRLPVAPHQYARPAGLGRADLRPDHARVGPDQGAAREAGILGQGLSEQLPPGLLRPRRQAPRAHGRFRREDPRRKGRHERHAAVVDRGRLRHAVPDRRRDQEIRPRAGEDRRALEHS